ncbi:MAG: BamA/TamA family outer membrane protein [Betaproteobacteria bacterium]|nr:BamA/TamA family outer membrane protein [Betaproteobacteria bacterium]
MRPRNRPPAKYLSSLGYTRCVRRVVSPVQILPMRPATRRWGRIVLLAIVITAVAPCSSAQPQELTKPGDSMSGERRRVRFRVEIDAPHHYETLLRERLSLMRWQSSEELTMPLLRRLVQEACASTQEALATDGYFSATVRATIDEAADQAIVRLQIEPGPRTTVESVQLDFQGAGLADDEGKERIEAVRNGWSLRKGDPFLDSRWVEAKRGALARLGRGRYAAAKLVESEARIVPEKSAAHLRLRLDSGPIFHAGGVNVSGLKRYSPAVVENFNPHGYGEPYDAIKMELYQRRLLETGYFSAVHFAVEPDIAKAAAAPLNIAVIEAPTQNLDTGILYTTDLGAGLKVDYGHVNVLERALRFRSVLDLNEKEQSLKVSLDAPPRPGGVWSTYSAGLERSDVQGLISRAAMIEYAHNWGLEHVPSRLFVSGHIEERSIAGFGREDAHAVFVGYRKTYRTTDELLTPREGLIGTMEVGVGIPALSSRKFARARGILNWLVPLGERNDFFMRAELGVVLAEARTGVPSTFLFRTGGDQTVRGYAFESIGVPLGDATVGGRYLAVASAEYTHWVTDTLGAAVFVDVGDAFDEPKAIDLALGVGIGMRYKSPIGPVRADVAFGERTGKVRIHFSVGYSF